MKSNKYKQSPQNGNGKPVLIEGARTPFVKSFGAFQTSDALELFSRVVDGLLRKLELDPQHIDEISAGVVIPQTKNANVARDAIINLGLPSHIHGATTNRACASSLHTIAEAARTIATGNPHLILSGGVECLSDVPIAYSRQARDFLAKLSKTKSVGAKLQLLGEFKLKSWIPQPPAIAEPLTGLSMGQHCEMMAQKNNISRAAQDEFALNSHLKAAKAWESGFFNDEVVPVSVAPKYSEWVDRDNMVRGDTSFEKLSQLRPAFDRLYGSLTPGNSSPLTDGASITLIADEQRARDLGLKPKARVVEAEFVGIDPYDQLLIGPALAIPLLLKRCKLSMKDIDLFEIHEAFAAQVLSCVQAMGSAEFCERNFGHSQAFGDIPFDKLNVNGGAIAIGHPFGATGARLVNSLANALKVRKGRYGVIAICAAGGMAGAMLIENIA
ncbi:MAG: acetyl-CoA C-acyltransferase [Oligoflexales bacterium]|nr:acetyl-CoA C-acyltransferase [Oligoflexales bacterium]